MQLSRDRGRGRRTEASKALKNQRAKERIATETEVERGLRLRRMGERASAIQAATSAQATIRGPYSEAEVLFMIRNPQLSSKELAFALGRTYGSVKTKRFHAIRPLEGSTHTA